MKKTKERDEQNAMTVTLVPANTASRLAMLLSYKQPVAEASINSNPLTLGVSVNGAKSDRLLKKGTFNVYTIIAILVATSIDTRESWLRTRNW